MTTQLTPTPKERQSIQKWPLFLTALLSATVVAQAADYFLPDIECDGSANVRNNSHPEEPISQGEIIKTLPNGTRVQIAPTFRKGDWLWYSNQGAYTEKNEDGNNVSIQGYIHKSQLKRID